MIATTTTSTVRATVKAIPSKAVLAYRRKMFIAGLKEATISGMPCLIEVDSCSVTKGNYSRSAETPDEYYGSSDVEFTVYDRKGYRAAWLEAKMTDDERSEIESSIIASYEEDYDEGYDD